MQKQQYVLKEYRALTDCMVIVKQYFQAQDRMALEKLLDKMNFRLSPVSVLASSLLREGPPESRIVVPSIMQWLHYYVSGWSQRFEESRCCHLEEAQARTDTRAH